LFFRGNTKNPEHAALRIGAAEQSEVLHRQAGPRATPHDDQTGAASRRPDDTALLEACVRVIGDFGTTQRYMHLSPATIDGTIELLEASSEHAGFGDILETEDPAI
jgi:hypothetical protein